MKKRLNYSAWHNRALRYCYEHLEASPKSHFLSDSLGGSGAVTSASFFSDMFARSDRGRESCPLPPSPESWEKIFRRLDQLSQTNLILLDIGTQLH